MYVRDFSFSPSPHIQTCSILPQPYFRGFPFIDLSSFLSVSLFSLSLSLFLLLSLLFNFLYLFSPNALFTPQDLPHVLPLTISPTLLPYPQPLKPYLSRVLPWVSLPLRHKSEESLLCFIKHSLSRQPKWEKTPDERMSPHPEFSWSTSFGR